ncbi:hypothetical protein PQU95_08830 [Vogesella sp. DC21W]|uniref:Uncharacterized protein n=1 Tax=Vogesella aquatica TaxID=2984206 RepID=A0ABT5IXM1_9NEIS|nr:hypothetical protein [Vogesella aquatica]MDC7717312.1 hypothetical protein [Vogesella aquatica]
MALGQTVSVVICTQGTPNRAPCPSGQTTKVLQAYVIDPSQQNNFEAATGPFDYGYASAIWALAFSTVVGLYFVSHGIGLVLGMIRRG